MQSQARNSAGGGEPVARGQGEGNLRSACVCVRLVHACGSLLCHGEEGWRKKAVALNKNVFILRERGEALSSICLPTETLLEDFSSFKSTKEGGRERERCSWERQPLRAVRQKWWIQPTEKWQSSPNGPQAEHNLPRTHTIHQGTTSTILLKLPVVSWKCCNFFKWILKLNVYWRVASKLSFCWAHDVLLIIVFTGKLPLH